jgi:hypothetical protein
MLTAFYGSTTMGVRITPAGRSRDWIDGMEGRWAQRCLPLLMANAAGWLLHNPIAFEAEWDGDPQPRGLKVTFDGAPPPSPVIQSHFGCGILTWSVPYLFRTPPGWNLLVRGPANAPRDGMSPLEGLVETDWAVATFTMNWQVTRIGHRLRFGADEPFCMIVPQRRGDLETFRPEIRTLTSDLDLLRSTQAWTESRHRVQVRKFLAEYADDFAADRDAWERHYFRGTSPDGTSASVHQTRLQLCPFADMTLSADESD